jgi:hypothetical protein
VRVPAGFTTTGDRGRVLIVELTGATAARTEGWVSYRFGQLLDSPIVELRHSGAVARFLTVLVPYPAGGIATVTERSVTAGGFAFTVTVDGRSERVVSRGGVVTIAPR